MKTTGYKIRTAIAIQGRTTERNNIIGYIELFHKQNNCDDNNWAVRNY